jgi:hypothetical protein
MKEIDIPLLPDWPQRPNPPVTDAHQKNVMEIRSILNKLAILNFPKLSNKILNDFHYSPLLLNELAVIKSVFFLYFLNRKCSSISLLRRKLI